MEPKSYIICSTVRSGSTLLCNSLGQLDGYGQPEEYFHRHTIKRLNLNLHPDKFLAYCQSISQEAFNRHGVFGIKMHWWQMFDFLNLARQSPHLKEKQDLEILNMLFPNPKFIYLWREDIIAQAISAAIALQTGQWENPRKSEPKPGVQTKKNPQKFRIKFQPWKIYEWETSLRVQNQAWQQFLQEKPSRLL